MTKRQYIDEKRQVYPQIYVYVDNANVGLNKVGFTTRQDVNDRIKEQVQIGMPNYWYQVIFTAPAMRSDGTTFTDKDIHKLLKKKGFFPYKDKRSGNETEWFDAPLEEIKKCYLAVKDRRDETYDRTEDFKMRQEQEDIVNETADYFTDKLNDENYKEKPHYLWNCKMRFGKTFATYKLMKKMGFAKVLVLTFKPAVEDAWKTDLLSHKDFEGYQYYSNKDGGNFDENKPLVVFGSLQDFLGEKNGKVKEKNKRFFDIKWDMIVLDEYHYGAWNDRVKARTEKDENLVLVQEEQKEYDETIKDIENREKEEKEIREEEGEFDPSKWKEDSLNAKVYLYLSGTPFRALTEGMFMEDQISNWTYSDEQRRKKEWLEKGFDNPKTNPYLELPEMIFMTYQLSNEVIDVIEETGKNEFSLNEFFRAKGEGTEAKFVYENEVQKFLDILRGKIRISEKDTLLPYDSVEMQNLCNHQIWFLPNISSCDAMENLLNQPLNSFFTERRRIVNCSGTKAGIGLDALPPVLKAIGDNPYLSKSENLLGEKSDFTTGTITLTCGKLTTGVTVRPWNAILMLSNCQAPETYFQTAFRVQSPWTTKNERGERVILKEKCYVFDFAPNRTLTLLTEYISKLDNDHSKSIVQKVDEFINFLPVLQFEDGVLRPVSATEIVDFVDSGTTSTMLARKWQSASLFYLSTENLKNVLDNPLAMEAIRKIEGWRKFGDTNPIEELVTRSDKIKGLRTKKKDGAISDDEKKELTAEEKEYRNRKKEILEKLQKFITRIPLFMYMSDYREETLYDVIEKFESELFERVTGLTLNDFNILVSTGIFNAEKIDKAVLFFRRYEDSSLTYLGIDKNSTKRNETIGAMFGKVRKNSGEELKVRELIYLPGYSGELYKKDSLEELEAEKQMDYLTLCSYLQKKYGMPEGDYFNNQYFTSVNQRIKKGATDGLILHHIGECHHIMLSQPEVAKQFDYRYQYAKYLCYCSYLEHLLLHIAITKEFNKEIGIELLGVGGVVNFIAPEINDYFLGYPYKRDWQIKALSKCKNYKEWYKKTIREFANYLIESDLVDRHPSIANFAENPFRGQMIFATNI